jgi:hypothetical protein
LIDAGQASQSRPLSFAVRHKSCDKDSLPELADDWRNGGTLIDDIAEPG